MSDPFKEHQSGLTSPASAAFSISPSNGNPLANVTRAIYVGGTGDLRVTMKGGETVVLSQVQAGVIYPLRCTHVMATGTTATGIVGLY